MKECDKQTKEEKELTTDKTNTMGSISKRVLKMYIVMNLKEHLWYVNNSAHASHCTGNGKRERDSLWQPMDESHVSGLILFKKKGAKNEFSKALYHHTHTQTHT